MERESGKRETLQEQCEALRRELDELRGEVRGMLAAMSQNTSK